MRRPVLYNLTPAREVVDDHDVRYIYDAVLTDTEMGVGCYEAYCEDAGALHLRGYWNAAEHYTWRKYPPKRG